MRFGLALAPVMFVAACGLTATGPVEEFVIIDPGIPVEVVDVVPVEPAPGFGSDLPAVSAPTAQFGCPAGAGVLYGGTQYCTSRAYR